ncbi:MAG: hypothetical protein JWN63_1316, partial [Candidatus Acidoferrum typicum]|nr:hypothetical protein [Candidatus Acidoferrum typicum]
PHLVKRNYILLGGSLLLATALALASSMALNRSNPVTLPDGTVIHVTLNQAVASDENRPGDHFEATVSEPVVVANKTIIPRGSPVQGIVVDAHHSGRLMGRSRLQLGLETVTVNGKDYKIHTSTHTKVGGKHKKRNVELIAGGAGGGALIGAIAAGGKGVLIGGPIGAGAGTAAALITGKKDVRIPPETSLTFKLAQPVTVNAKG